MLLLDASEAFDIIKYACLFNHQRPRNMCPVVLRLTKKMYILLKFKLDLVIHWPSNLL